MQTDYEGYMRGFMLEKAWNSCIFSNIIEGKAPSYKIYEEVSSIAVHHVNNFAKGHCLVIPNEACAVVA